MFALWYLSLALDELRKYLGWTSIFDIFDKNKTGSSKAIDSKPTQPEKKEASELPKKPEQPKVPENKAEPQPQLPSKRIEPASPVEPIRPASAQLKPASPNMPEKLVGQPKFEPKAEPPKSLPPKADPPKPETPKAEPPKPEPPKTEAPKFEPPKIEPPKVEPPKVSQQPSKPKDLPFNSAFTANAPTTANSAVLFTGGNPDQKLFSSTPKGFENGDHFTDLTKPSTNVKDATSSFLEGEGRAPNANQPKREKR